LIRLSENSSDGYCDKDFYAEKNFHLLYSSFSDTLIEFPPISTIASFIAIFMADVISPNNNIHWTHRPIISPDPSPTRQSISPVHSISDGIGDAFGNEGVDGGNGWK
jgi:hypothetical protein